MLAAAMLPAVGISFSSLHNQLQSVPAHELTTQTAVQPDTQKNLSHKCTNYASTRLKTEYHRQCSSLTNHPPKIHILHL